MLKNSARATDVQAPLLGERLRRRRKDLGLTLNDVAQGAGLSVGFISQVERDLTAPSLGSLVTIASVLEIPVNALLESPATDRELTRQSDRAAFAVPGQSASYERLSASFLGSTLHSVLVHEPPGHRVEPISHTGEEMFYIIDGELTVEIEGRCEILRQGDSLHFNSRRTHSTWNHTEKPVSLLWCGTMDIFGDENPEPIHRHSSNTRPSTE